MTIAEAGLVGRIKHNFLVMVRGVGFSTLIISSASQSRPLSRPPALLSARVSLHLSVSLPVRPRSWEYISMHFPEPLAPHSPLPAPSFSPPATLQQSFHRLLSTLSDNFRRPRQSSLRLVSFLSVPLSPLFLPSFSCFNYQLFPVFQKFALKQAAFSRRHWWFLFYLLISYLSILSLLVSQCCFFFFFFSLSKARVSARRRYIQQSVFGTCSFRLRSTSAKRKYTQSRAERRFGKSCNAPLSIRRLPPLFCLFIRLFNSPPASDRLRNVICQRLCSAMYPRKYTSDGNARRRRVQSGVALSQYRIVKTEILPATKSANPLILFQERKASERIV